MAYMEQFAQFFKDEHRRIRDALLNLIQVFRNRDPQNVRLFLNQVAILSGPHFRYEKEAFYPALVEVLYKEHVDKLLADHDGAIETARRLSELAQKDALTAQDAQTGAKYARSLLPHVFECEGLSIIAELFARSGDERGARCAGSVARRESGPGRTKLGVAHSSPDEVWV